MPRHIDPELEQKVLAAAHALWHKGGEKALSIRKVAKLAGTNPPALYRRFRDREAILKALVESYQLEFLRAAEPCSSIQEFVMYLLDLALQKPREYELVMWGLGRNVTKTRPVVELFMQRCAEWLGGSPRDHMSLALALASLFRGTVAQVLEGSLVLASPAQAKTAFMRAANVLVANERALRDGQ